MYLAQINILNFRKISSLSVPFKAGLNILLGENNIGKTTIVDALRALLSGPDDPYVRLGIEDANQPNPSAIAFTYIFKGLSQPQAAHFIGAAMPETDGSFTATFIVRYDSPDTFGRFKIKRYCGERAATLMTSEMLEQLRGVYLPPLRDASKGLRPGSRSQLARLLLLLATGEGMAQCTSLLAQLDRQLDVTQPIVATKAAIVDRFGQMLGVHLTQGLDLNLSPLDMKKVASRLSILADGFEIECNGLGYNNLIFMAAILGELAMTEDAVYRSLIIEEPEAHLHPQLQAVLLHYFQQQTELPGSEEVQLFVTTHSPHFAAFSHLDNLISIRQRLGMLVAFAIKNAQLDPIKKRKLQRFIDVTRSDIFFAKCIIMVEGSAERSLIPAMAELMQIDLRRLSVTLISVEGLNFDCFLPLFGDRAMPVPVAVLTDRDPSTPPYPALLQEADISATARSLLATNDTYRRTFIGTKTLEYDLALQGPVNRSIMLSALNDLHPEIATDLANRLAGIQDNTQAAICLFQGMFERPNGLKNVSKGRFAQELADKLRTRPLGFVVPAYVVQMFAYVQQPTTRQIPPPPPPPPQAEAPIPIPPPI